MHEININILQRSFISLIFFLFFNVNLIEKCKTLRIKIKVLNFIDNINILIYNRFIEKICKTLSRAHDICMKWVHTHDTTFASEKYKFMHFMISIQIESSVIKSKSDVQVLKVQLNMKLQ